MNDKKNKSIAETAPAEHSEFDTRVYRICLTISLVWIAIGILYCASEVTLARMGGRPSNFLRMWPHEVGSLLSGWVAPLAALWVFAAVILQRAQLEAQRRQLDQTREQLQRSMAQLETGAVATQLTRLSERLMHGTLRFARTGEGVSLYLVKHGQREPLAQIVGGYRRYADLFKGYEPALVVDKLGRGLDAFVRRINEDWVMHGDIARIEELGTELSSLLRIVSEMQSVAPKLSELHRVVPQLITGMEAFPASAELERFRQYASKASMTLELMLHDLRNFDVPEDASVGFGS